MRPFRMRLPVLVVVLGTLATGCSDSTAASGGWVIDIGLLLPELSRAPVISVPQTIVAGQPAAITINTFGSSTCVRQSGVAVEGAGTRVQTLTPLDSVARGGQICTDDLAQHPHPVVLMFSQAGTATIRVRGYVRGPDLVRRIDTIEASIVVRP